MSNLPKGWAFASLPDLVGPGGIFIDGDWIESKDQDPNGDVRLIQLADIGDGRYVDKSNRFLTHEKAIGLGCTFLAPGDVLIARMPDPLGRACIFPGDKRQAVTVVDVCVVRGKSEYFDNAWLMHFVNSSSFRTDIHSLQSGSTRKRISRGNLSTLKLPVPPRVEQTRIVAKLEELLSDLDAGMAELKAAQKKLQQYRQSLLKAAVEGELTASWRKGQRKLGIPVETGAQLLARILTERRASWEAKKLAKFKEQGKTPPKDWQKKYPEPVEPDTTDLPMLPEEWVWASLDQLLGQLRSGTAETSARDSTAYPVLKSSAVRPGSIDFSALNYLRAEQSHEENYLEDGDLLVTRLSGSVQYVGCCALVDSISPMSVQYPDRIFCGKLALPSQEIAIHVTHAFRSPSARARIEVAAKSTAGHKRISLSDLHPFPVPLPPLAEISALGAIVQAALQSSDQMEAALELASKQYTAQRQNILRAAFSGQLVPQDQNDEPATVLLDRIRSERAERAKKPRSRNTVRSKGMQKSVSESVSAWVNAKKEIEFTFEDLRSGVPADYDALKDEVFRLLASPSPLIGQIFDQESGALRFRKNTR